MSRIEITDKVLNQLKILNIQYEGDPRRDWWFDKRYKSSSFRLSVLGYKYFKLSKIDKYVINISDNNGNAPIFTVKSILSIQRNLSCAFFLNHKELVFFEQVSEATMLLLMNGNFNQFINYIGS